MSPTTLTVMPQAPLLFSRRLGLSRKTHPGMSNLLLMCFSISYMSHPVPTFVFLRLSFDLTDREE